MKGSRLRGPLKVSCGSRGQEVAEYVQVASTFAARLRGLLGRRVLPQGHGLAIYPCSSIHTFCMRFPIDAIFIDKRMEVLRVYRDLPPWRVSAVIKGAWAVLELPAGSADRAGVELGGKLIFEPLG